MMSSVASTLRSGMVRLTAEYLPLLAPGNSAVMFDTFVFLAGQGARHAAGLSPVVIATANQHPVLDTATNSRCGLGFCNSISAAAPAPMPINVCHWQQTKNQRAAWW